MSGLKRLLAAPRWRAAQDWALVAFAVALPLGESPAEVALGVGLAAFVGRTVLGHRSSIVPRSPLNGLLLVWAILAVCSIVNSVDLEASLHGCRKLLKHFGLFVLILDTLDNERSMRRLLTGCMAGLSLLVGDALWQAIAGRDLIYGQPPAWTIDAVERVTGTYHHPSSLSIYLVAFAPLLVALAPTVRRRWRVVVWGLVGLTIVVVVLNRSRAGFLAFLGALGLVALWLRRWIPVALAAATAGLEAATLPPAVKAWAASMPSLWDQLTQPDRPLIWHSAMEMVKAHPFLGVGVNTFVKAYPTYAVPGDPFGATGTGPYAHNQYLQLAAEVGVFELIVLLVLVVLVFRSVGRCLAARETRPLMACMAAGLGAGLAGYLFIGGFESSLFYARAGGIFWLLVGWIIAAERLWTRPPAPT
jgi:O-antigen ligase